MVDSTTLPAAKQTTLGLYVTAAEAYEKWKAAPDKTKIIDVRTPEEFIFVGHPDMAWNVPLIVLAHEWDATGKQLAMKPTADFIDRVKEVASPDDILLVTCRSGGRGAAAVNLLASAGFRHSYNIVDGIEGDDVCDPESLFFGKRLKNGWKNSGLPWTYALDPEKVRLPKSSEVRG